VTVQAFDIFGGSRVGFMKATTDVSNGAGETLPGAVFLRGPSVAMLVVLVPDDIAEGSSSGDSYIYDGERYALMTVQPRVAAGSLEFAELPAGMVDDEGSFAGAAAKEIKEELGLEIHESELTCLSELAAQGAADESRSGTKEAPLPPAMYPSPGGCDEFITMYLHERRVPRDLWKEGARDAKCLSALALLEGLKREGKL
jgi:8-oxo-dGTP pyrophosphatase MutT (NUDIX family)